MSRWTKKSASSSKTKYYKLKGLCSYAQMYEPDEFRGASNWKINLHPSQEVIDEIKQIGIQLEIKDREADNIDEKDARHYCFKRPTERKFGQTVTYFCPPEIFIKGERRVWYEVDGEVVNTFKEGEDPQRCGEVVLIGNGSVVEIEIEVWHGGMGVGNRLKRVNVLDLIEYTPPEEVDPDEAIASKSTSGAVGEAETEVNDEGTIDDVVEEKPKEKTPPKSKKTTSGVDW